MDLRQVKAIESANKKKLLKLFPNLNDGSGIYVLYRFEDEIKYAYVGQAKKILTRLADHIKGYQHIDLSIKKYGWYSEENKTGWRAFAYNYPEYELDEKEQYFIKECAKAGYQLRNKTAGGQGEGKTQIADYRPAKGYHDGLEQGIENLRRKIKHIVDTHLIVQVKKDTIPHQKALAKFYSLLEEPIREDEDVTNESV